MSEATTAPEQSGGIEGIVRAVPGVVTLYPSRVGIGDLAAIAADSLGRIAELAGRDAARGARTTGGTGRDPVLIQLSEEAVTVAVDISVRADDGAADTARAVSAAVQEWCRSQYPALRPLVSVRVAFVD